MAIYNTNVDLGNDNVHMKFGYILSIHSQDIEKQDFPDYKSVGIFSDAQGQLTPQSLVESSLHSNLSEILWLSSLHARIKKIRSKMKELECSQH